MVVAASSAISLSRRRPPGTSQRCARFGTDTVGVVDDSHDLTVRLERDLLNPGRQRVNWSVAPSGSLSCWRLRRGGSSR